MTPASTSGIHESAAALVESMQRQEQNPAPGISSPFAIIVTSRRIFRRARLLPNPYVKSPMGMAERRYFFPTRYRCVVVRR